MNLKRKKINEHKNIMKTKTKILKAFLENKEAKTIKEVSKTIKADYRITHTAVQQLLNQKILLLRKVGNNSLCSLNPDYYGTEIYQAEEERKQAVLQDRNINLLHQEIMNKINASHFTFLLLSAKKPLPINLFFISNEANVKKKIQEIISLIPLQIEAEVVTEEEFKRKGLSGGSAIILYGIESYYALKGSP